MGLFKLAVMGFIALVVIGLGFQGTINAAMKGAHTVESQPMVQQTQQKIINDVKVHLVEPAINKALNDTLGVVP